MSLEDEKYVLVSTFRKSGAAVSTPTWIVPLDGGRVGFWTSSAAGKTKRLRNNAKITLQPSDGRGRVKAGTDTANGTAVLVTEGPDFDSIQSKVRAKYGVMVPVTKVLYALGHIGKARTPYGDVGVVVTLDN